MCPIWATRTAVTRPSALAVLSFSANLLKGTFVQFIIINPNHKLKILFAMSMLIFYFPSAVYLHPLPVC